MRKWLPGARARRSAAHRARAATSVLRALPILVAAGAAFAASAPDFAAPARGLRQALANSPIVSPLVLAAIETQGHADVLIAFERTPAGTWAERRARVRARGDALMLGLSDDDFSKRRRFRSLHAVAGRARAPAILRLARDPRVLRIDLDEGGRGHLAEAIPLSSLDVLEQVGLDGNGVTVAVLDSGVDLDHPDLAGKVIAEHCNCSGGGGCCPGGGSVEDGAGAAEDDHGHGTNVSGIVASSGNVASRGGAPAVKIVAVKVLDSNNVFSTSSDVVAGLDWVLEQHLENPSIDVDLVNMSLGTNALFTTFCDTATSYTMAYAEAVDALRDEGILSIVSSGNNQSTTRMAAPACVTGSLSVGAVWDADVGSQNALGCTDSSTMADLVTCFSNRNVHTHVMAPGAPMISSGLEGGTSTFRGTSQATALVTGCAALLRQGVPKASVNALVSALVTSPVAVPDPENSNEFPRLDCVAALDALTPQNMPALGPPSAAALVTLLAAFGWAISRRASSRAGRGRAAPGA